MRYIGNKQKLLPFLKATLEACHVRSRSACDPFAGTAAVSRFLKGQGQDVLCGDIMEYSFVMARATVECDEPPRFRDLGAIAAGPRPLDAVLAYLNRLPGQPGLVYREYAPAGPARRRYFTPLNAARIDAIRSTVRDWYQQGRLTGDEVAILLASLLEAADRVANTTGVYAAFVKTWQPNARRPIRLTPPPLVTGTGRRCEAHRADALDLVANAGPFDLLYLDPPYNSRQYIAYYHIPELLVTPGAWPPLRGKTGLIPADGKQSIWCRRGRCEEALEQVVALAPCRYILMSYNSEGIIPESAIERIFKRYGQPDTYRAFRRPYRRYRSDQDGQNRNYRADVVTEVLHFVDRGPIAASARGKGESTNPARSFRGMDYAKEVR